MLNIEILNIHLRCVPTIMSMRGLQVCHGGAIQRLGGHSPRPQSAALRMLAIITQPQHRFKRLFSSDDSLLTLARMSLTQMPKYLTGDRAAIEAFIDQFDVRT